MARTDNISNFLTDVATAIKTKKGSQTPIQASNFDTEIANLPSGSVSVDKKVCFAYTGSGEPSWTVDWSFISSIDFTGRSSFKSMFQYAEALTSLPVSSSLYNGITYNNAFSYTKLTSANISFPNATTLTNTFYNCQELVTCSVNAPNCIFASYMCSGAKKLTSASVTLSNDTTRNFDTTYMFDGCTLLNSVTITCGHISAVRGMFRDCSSLVTAPSLDISKSTRINNVFSNCTSLENVPVYNISAVTNNSYIQNYCSNCPNLTNESLHNIVKTLVTSSITSGSNRKLSYVGLSQAQATTCTTFDEWTTLSNAGWTTGY